MKRPKVESINMTCKICNKTYSSRSLGRHVNQSHQITPEEYYKKYISSDESYCYCGNKLTKFINIRLGYGSHCSHSCGVASTTALDKRRSTCMATYGVDSIAKLKSTKDKKKEICLEKYGVEISSQSSQAKEAYKGTCLEKYGADSHLNNTDIQDKIKTTNLEKYGAENVFANSDIQDKIKQTMLDKYGVGNPMQLANFRNIAKATKIANGSYGTSKPEEDLYLQLKSIYPEVLREYKSEDYPFHCDFYIPSIDVYVEYQGTWTHGYRAFFNTKDDKEVLLKWQIKAVDSGYYRSAIKNWTIIDVLKRQTARDNNLKYIEIFRPEDIPHIEIYINRVITGLSSKSTDLVLDKEMVLISNNSKLTSVPNRNKNVLHFQKHFFETERNLYSNDAIVRRKLIQNRIKYLFKEEHELTDMDLLRGFKISGAHYSYSHFSSSWIKYFLDKYLIKTLYDPFGGWGHRMLGCQELDLYVYNDISKKTYDGINDIKKFHNMENVITYNEDAKTLKVKEEYQAIFISPPYDNLEKYEVLVTTMKELIDGVLNNNTANIIAVVIREDFEHLLSRLGEWQSKEMLNGTNSHLGNKKLSEHLYVWVINK